MNTNLPVKVVRLLSGEDVLAKVDMTATGGATLYSPVVIVQQPPTQQGGQMGLGFVNWPLFAERDEVVKNGVVVSYNAIVMTYTPIADMINQYNTRISGLITPTRPSLLLG